MLRVGFNARLLYSPEIRGWTRYTINLLEGLVGRGVHPVLYTDTLVHRAYLDRLPEGSCSVRVSPPLPLLRWLYRWLPAQCRADRLDLLHSPYNLGLPPWSPCPRVLTLHDAIAQADSATEDGAGLTRLTPGALKFAVDGLVSRARADLIITPSEAARGDLLRILKLPPRKVFAVSEAADPAFHRPVAAEDRERVRRVHDLPARYLFYVGGWEGRKNIPFLLRGFARAGLDDVHLVLAGGRAEQRAELLGMAEALGIAGRLRLLGWVEEADLPALYAEALGFVYPSRYEGFGLQLCEAMAVGCATLAARATSLPEVLGDGGETFALDDTAELVALLRRLASDPDFRRPLSERALARSGQFSWSHTAERTVALYRQLTGAPEPAAARAP